MLAVSQEMVAFLAEQHLATFTTLRPDGSPHVVPVGFTFDPVSGIARVIAGDGSRKIRNIEDSPAAARVVLCQVDRARWASLEGTARVTRDPDSVAEAVRGYALRYQAPRVNPRRVAIEIAVDRLLGRP